MEKLTSLLLKIHLILNFIILYQIYKITDRRKRVLMVIAKNANTKKGYEMKRIKKYRWNFYKMHPSLQILSILLGGLAFVGWTLMGTWFLYFLMK